MSEDILFDPHELTNEQKQFLFRKLDKVSSPPDRDGCRRFMPKSRASNGKYGRITTRPDIGKLFGKESRGYNSSKLLYCLAMGIVWRQNMEIECSHLCGYKLCMEMTHINLEPHKVNTQRTEHHSAFECPGHDDHPDCVIKSYTPESD